MTAPTPQLSLCMIVRDEAEMLPAFLEAARGAWDELVAVDTGSVDSTARLLRDAGAIVLDHPWAGDFSEARNFGLQHARGEWILVLDADERVGPALAAEIRRCCANPAAGAASLRILNELPHGHSRGARLLRLFRNDRAIRFRHSIHEDVSESVAAFLARVGLRRVDLVEPLLHLGYAREHAASRNKKERDVSLLRAALARDPHDLYAWLKLLEQARFWDDRPLLASGASDAASVLARLGDGPLRVFPQAGELLSLMVDGLHSEPRRALAWLSAFAGLISPSAHYSLRLGELREVTGDDEGARRAFDECLSLDGLTGHLQLTTVRPRLGLARLDLAAGNLALAEHRAEEALRIGPLDPEALLLVALLRCARGGRPALLGFEEERRSISGDQPEIEAAVLEAARLSGIAPPSR